MAAQFSTEEPAVAAASSLFGRGDELAALAGLIGLSAEGQGQSRGGAVLLAGDAGVGKTRLLTELAGLAQAADWHVLIGHCLDFAGDSLPYVPFTEVFGRLARDASLLSETLLRSAPALARLLPGKRLLASEDPAGGDDPPERSGAHVREELFEAVHLALRQLSRSAPVLLIVEDVHWADPSTRDLLRFLFVRSRPQPSQWSSPIALMTFTVATPCALRRRNGLGCRR